jgi:hypothetical protein
MPDLSTTAALIVAVSLALDITAIGLWGLFLGRQ